MNLNRAIYLHSLEESDEDLDFVPRKPRVFRARPNFLRDMEDEEFLTKFRISKSTFAYLLERIGNKIESQTTRNFYLTPEDKLMLALRYYACGNFLIAVGDFCRVSAASASRTVKEVSYSIAALSREYIKFGEPDEVQEDFHSIANFPRVMGAVGCTHIQVQSPAADQSEMYRNRKGFFSIKVQAVSDAKLNIQDLVARWPGSTQESIIFDNSRLKKRFEAEEFGSTYLLGDSSYTLRKYMMTPLRKPITKAEKLYNESQFKTREVVTKSFDVWKHRFPVLSFGMRINIDTAKVVIVACAILHNIAISVQDPEPPIDEDLPLESLDCVESYTNNGTVNSSDEHHRNQFIKEYFHR
ncbi:putative nuclease HARBI1 [Drosophila serrata]|uniref:putative nuclease HARBI1 n=1 Tax=Drosophila serrata TaxID=7274 RepID=UPI000A1D052F|nr:putative nuclease HARBI1 [Drosophila serrata]